MRRSLWRSNLFSCNNQETNTSNDDHSLTEIVIDPISSSSFNPMIEIKELKQIFKNFDANKDGKISFSELSMLMDNIGKKVSERALQRAMKMVDSDGDNFIKMKEFIEMATKGFDFDKVTKEVEKIMTSFGRDTLIEDCKKIVSSFDSNKDGMINFEEFHNLIKSFFPSSFESGSTESPKRANVRIE